MDAALLLVIIGGFLEPVWVVGLKKYNETHSLAWGAFAVAFLYISPGVLSFAMQSMHVGVAYAIWTGIGSVLTVLVSRLLYDEKLDRLKILFIFMIVAGVMGLEMSSEMMP